MHPGSLSRPSIRVVLMVVSGCGGVSRCRAVWMKRMGTLLLPAGADRGETLFDRRPDRAVAGSAARDRPIRSS